MLHFIQLTILLTGGWNNNPNAQHFRTTFNELVFHCDDRITGSSANISPQDDTSGVSGHDLGKSNVSKKTNLFVDGDQVIAMPSSNACQVRNQVTRSSSEIIMNGFGILYC